MPSLLGTGPGVHYKSLKTVNQSLEHKVNRCVLSLRLNECKLSASRTLHGGLKKIHNFFANTMFLLSVRSNYTRYTLLYHEQHAGSATVTKSERDV